MIIEAKHVTKRYVMGKVTLQVLKGVSLKIESGTCVTIMGPSGAGKSTLLHVLAGLDTPTSGEVRWDGEKLSTLSDGKRAAVRNHKIGIVFQFYHLLPELTALENVMLPARVGRTFSGKELRLRAEGLLNQVGLGSRLRHKPRELSGGEQQRVAIARALMNEPQTLLCDEPTGNLDSKTGAEVIELLFALRRQHKLGLLLVTHQVKLAELADQAIVLEDGKIIESAAAERKHL